MDKNFNEFCNFLVKNKFSDNLIKSFKIYQSVLAEKNEKLSLVSKNSLDRIWSAHFLDSILICEEIDFSKKSVLDFGTGAGFPGIPLKILYPTMRIFLLESVRKKTLFLRYLLEKLDLQEYEIINITGDVNVRFGLPLIQAIKAFKDDVVVKFKTNEPYPMSINQNNDDYKIKIIVAPLNE